MKGFPQILNTRKDYENCHTLTLAGNFSKTLMINQWKSLLNRAKHWIFKAVVDSTYIVGNNEKVMVDVNPLTGELKYTCLEYVDNYNAEMYQLAYSVSTINQKIAELEAL